MFKSANFIKIFYYTFYFPLPPSYSHTCTHIHTLHAQLEPMGMLGSPHKRAFSHTSFLVPLPRMFFFVPRSLSCPILFCHRLNENVFSGKHFLIPQHSNMLSLKTEVDTPVQIQVNLIPKLVLLIIRIPTSLKLKFPSPMPHASRKATLLNIY